MAYPKPDIDAVLEGLPGRTVPQTARMAGIAGIVLGLVGVVVGIATGNTAWTFGAVLVGILYTIAIAQGGVVFSAILRLTWAHWGRPAKRIAESFGFFLPFAWLALVIFSIVGIGLYPWHEGTWLLDEPIPLEPHSPEAPPAKQMWLNVPFFIARQVLFVGTLVALSMYFLRSSLRPDLILAKQKLGSKYTIPGWLSPLVGSLDGAKLEDEVAKTDKTTGLVGILIGALFPLVFSFMVFDMVMSLAPWWYANMFGVWTFASGFWLSLAFLGIVGLLTRDWLGIKPYFNSDVTHDIGKLCMAFCMFWAYTFYAQLLPIWYGNMPEETDFLLIRIRLPQWAWLARTVGVLCFITPFTVLTSRGIKKMKWPFIGILSVIAVGIFLERTLLVMPSIYFESTFPWSMLFVSISIWLGFLGAFVLVVTQVLASVPPLPISDPKLGPHPWDEHAHSLDHHAPHPAK